MDLSFELKTYAHFNCSITTMEEKQPAWEEEAEFEEQLSSVTTSNTKIMAVAKLAVKHFKVCVCFSMINKCFPTNIDCNMIMMQIINAICTCKLTQC